MVNVVAVVVVALVIEGAVDEELPERRAQIRSATYWVT